MLPKLLITGAAGRIAQWVIPFLESKFELHLTDRARTEIGGRPIRPLNIMDYQAVHAAMQGMDAVVHLAIASNREFVTDLPLFEQDLGEEYMRFNQASLDVNVRGTYHVFEAARQAGVKRVVYGSSVTTLMGYPADRNLDDALPAQPLNFYAVTKLWGEQVGEYFSRRHGLTVYCLRFGTPHPQPHHPKFKLWIQSPVREAPFVTIEDMANAIDSAVTVPDGPAFGAYTIVSVVEDSRYDCSKALEIGWRSQSLCQDGGAIVALAR